MKKRNLRLQTKIMILSTIFSFIVIAILGGYTSQLVTYTFERKMGENALSLAKTIASMPEIHRAFQLKEPSEVIQPLMEGIRQEVGAEFIVVGNDEGVRYSHPFPDRLGKKMVGGDNAGVLKEGKAYVSRAVGTLGPSLRGKAPILSSDGSIIGVVSVGFLIEDIKEREQDHIIKILGIIMIVILIGFGGSFYLAWNIKKDIFGLEPEEISELFLTRQTILESVKEGIIAVDKVGKITVVNEAALTLLQTSHPVIGQPIQEVLSNTKILDVLESGEAQYDQEMLIENEWVVTNRVPMVVKGNVIGAVASFRKKTEIDRLLQELTDHKNYLDTLRAQNHEFTNTLYTISGMLQLGRYEEAIQFIHQEATHQDDMIEFLIDHVVDPKLSAFFIGKLTRAEEQKIKLIIDPETQLLHERLSIPTEDVITVYGNLIENAFDSVREERGSNRKVEVLMQERQGMLYFRIEDFGHGVSDEISNHIYTDGFTTKDTNKNKGIGLALVTSIVRKYEGRIDFYKPENHTGVIFEVLLPIEERGGELDV